MILRLLEHPVEILLKTARNQRIELRFKPEWSFGCSVTLAGYGYPYVQVRAPALPIEVGGPFDAGCDVWWNEVSQESGERLMSTGHRIGDVIAFGSNLEQAIQGAYRNIRRIRSLGSYYRPDIGKSLWPPGTA
jgi:phosphoribosylamine-glycine ligase